LDCPQEWRDGKSFVSRVAREEKWESSFEIKLSPFAILNSVAAMLAAVICLRQN
jgi:hypothetical protein